MTSYEKSRQTQKANGASQFFAFTPAGEGLWWPFRDIARALLQTQSNAQAYLEANRRLADELRIMIRKEQDLALELAESTLQDLSRSGRPASARAASDETEINRIFDRAASGMRELGEAWLDAQVRSLDIMRSCAQSRSNVGKKGLDQSEARAA